MRLKRKFLTLCDTERTLYGQLSSLEEHNEALQELLERQAPISQHQKLEYERIKNEMEILLERENKLKYEYDAVTNIHNKQSIQYNDLRKKYGKVLHERDELKTYRKAMDGAMEKFKTLDNTRKRAEDEKAKIEGVLKEMANNASFMDLQSILLRIKEKEIDLEQETEDPMKSMPEYQHLVIYSSHSGPLNDILYCFCPYYIFFVCLW